MTKPTPPPCKRPSTPPSRRATRSARTRPARCATRWNGRSTCSTAAKPRVAEKKDGGWTVNQWLKKAVLLSFRLNPMALITGGPEGSGWWDKVPSKFDGWSGADFDQGRLPRRAQLHRAALRLHRAGRGADAVLRQSRRLCRCGHHGRHLGDGRLLRPDRQERAHLRRRRHRRRAGAAAGRTGDHRGQLLHRRPRRGGRGRHRRRGLGAVDGRLSRRLDQDRRPGDRRDPHGPGAALFGGRVRRDARQAIPEQRTRPLALLRGDRQEGRREDAGQDSVNELLRD